MARLYVNRAKPNPRKGEKFSVIQKGGQTFHKYGPGRVFSGGPRPKSHAAQARGRRPPAAAARTRSAARRRPRSDPRRWSAAPRAARPAL